MVEDVPTTKAGLGERGNAALARIDAALAHLTVAQLLEPGTVGDWSLRDVLAHLSAEWLPAQLEAYLDGREATAHECFGDHEPPGPEVDQSTQDGRNAWQHERDAQLTLDEVRARFARYRRRMDALLARLSDDELAAPYVLEPLGYVGRLRRADPAEGGLPLWRWIQGNAWHHYEAHLPQFEATARAG